MKVVINVCYGGFSLSQEAYKALGIEWDEELDGYGCAMEDERNNPKLIEVVEKLDDKANGESAKLKIIEIPDDIEWYVDDVNNGFEIVREKHRVWR